MESQESDICAPDEMEMMLGDPNVPDLMLDPLLVDWSAVVMPTDPPVNPTGQLPSRTEFTGVHLFDAKVDMSGQQKKLYYMSTKLNKVFVDLGKVVPIQIKWDGTANLYVRALMMFTQPDQWKNPVKRCVTHRDKEDPTNRSYDHSDHVLAMENEGAEYAIDPVSKRHSVRVQLHLQSGCEFALISLKFMCKTSCTGGLNRAPTDVVFTLEDANGVVLGRQVIGVKICSCPKRDKEKDEQNLGEPSNGKRKVKVKREEKQSQAEEPPLKRVKQEFPNDAAPVSFMVTAVNAEVAKMFKENAFHWNQVKMVELCAPGDIPTPVISLTDDIAVLPQPYN